MKRLKSQSTHKTSRKQPNYRPFLPVKQADTADIVLIARCRCGRVYQGID